ncbi:MAG: hypothetical protein ACHQ16_07200 [Candidatus Lutacidiplasmatales archaeon]
MLIAAFVLFLAGPPAAEPAYFRLELEPSGSQVSIGEPVVKSGILVFHAYPDGKLMSLRRSDVKSSKRITAKEAAAPANPKPIANLAMQGGTATVVGGSSGGSPGQTAPASASGGSAPTRSIAPASSAATGTNAVLPP